MLIVVPAIGRLLYDVEIPWEHLPAVLVTLAIGAASFCCLGIALTAVIPSEEAAPAITNVAVLPLYFLSGVFIPETEIPDGRAPLRRPVPDPPLLRGVLRRLGPADRRRRASNGAISPWSPGGARWASCSRSASSAGRRGAVERPRLDRFLGVIHHVSVDVSDLEASGRFYDAVLGSLGWRRHLDDERVIAWGIVRPVFFAHARGDRGGGIGPRLLRGQRPLRGQGGLGGRRRRAGGADDGAPGPRPEYGGNYYSAYLLDPDGHRIEIAVQN